MCSHQCVKLVGITSHLPLSFNFQKKKFISVSTIIIITIIVITVITILITIEMKLFFFQKLEGWDILLMSGRPTDCLLGGYVPPEPSMLEKKNDKRKSYSEQCMHVSVHFQHQWVKYM